jgi:hypothetical protein
MKHIKTEDLEKFNYQPRLITIELTNKELDYIIAHMNVSDTEKVKNDLKNSLSIDYVENLDDELFDNLIILSDYE